MAISSSNLTPVELQEYAEIYAINDGSSVSRYTTYTKSITFEMQDYKPAHIKRGEITRNTTFEPVTCQITAPLEEKLVKYLSNYPTTPVKVKIYRGLVSNFDSQNILIFEGNVKTVQLEGIYAVAECVSLGSILEATWPKDIHSSFCQNTLYDTKCGLDANEFAISFLVGDITSTGAIISPTIGTSGPLFTHGYVVCNNQFRWITSGQNNQLNLHVPFDSSVHKGVLVTAYQGCSKSAIDCKNKFNNLANFYGCPYIPSDNPVIWGA